MSVTAETFQSFHPVLALSTVLWTFAALVLLETLGDRAEEVVLRYRNTFTFYIIAFLNVLVVVAPFNVEESIEAAAAAKACSPSMKCHNAREERNAKDIDTDDEEEEEEEEEESPRSARFHPHGKGVGRASFGSLWRARNEEKEGTRGKTF